MVMVGWMRALLLVAVTACGSPSQIVNLSDANVVVAGGKGGGIVNKPQPVAGAPISDVLGSASRCIPAVNLLALLGPPCSRETENAASGEKGDVGDLDAGKPERTPEVRWYCDGRLVVRVRFEPCDIDGDEKPDGVTPVEIAVATHRP